MRVVTPSTVPTPRPSGKGSKNARGRPRLEDGQGLFQLQDLERVEAYGVSRRAQAIALSEYWRELGVQGLFHPVIVPGDLRKAALELLPPVPPAPDPVVFAQAVLELLPPRQYDDPRRLRRQGRSEEAELEEFHEQITVAVKRIRRLTRRSRERAVQHISRLGKGAELGMN
jgi:hypothetical protein